MIGQGNIYRYVNTGTILSFFVVLKILIHLISPEYGYARDELYYLTISENFTFNNLEILPITPLYIKLITSLFGISIKSIHLASALCGAGAIIFSGLMTRELGGSKSAVALTTLTVLLSGFLIFGGFMSYDSVDFLMWTAAIYLLIRIIKYDHKELWVVFGIVIGIGLLNKLTIALFGTAIIVSLIFVKQREHFKSFYMWIGGVIALIAVIPFVLWQIKTDWYYIQFVKNYSGGLSPILTFPEYVWGQLLPNNPFNAIFWIPGLFALLFVNRFKQYRFLGVAYLMLFFGCFFLGTKFYFIMPFYTVLLATGSIQVIRFLNNKWNEKNQARYLKTGLISGYILVSLPIVPHMMPILKVESLTKYVKHFGVNAGVKYEYAEINELPQHFADRFGWEEMVDTIAISFNHISNRIGKEPGILTANWGQASAVYVHGKENKLPEPITVDGWFYHNTLANHSFNTDYVAIGFDSISLSEMFSEITKLAHYSNHYCMPFENNKTIYHCSNSKVDMREYWLIAKSPDKEFIRILNQESIRAAIDYYYKQKAKNHNALLFTEAQINKIGYDFLNKGDTDSATEIFKFNIDVFPESFNVYDSYAEALMNSGNFNLSVVFYKKSLEINPNNLNAINMLEKIYKINIE